MKSLLECLYESPNIILESTPEDVKAMKKWLKSHQAKKLKVVGDEIVLAGKTGAVFNEITFDGSEKELPEFVKFQKEPFVSTLEINGKGLETLKGFPTPGAAAHLSLYNFDSLEDFDMDFSNNDVQGTINFYDCTKLKSFSGFKTIKTKYPHVPYVYIYRATKLTSLEDFDGAPVRLCYIEESGIKSLKGLTIYPDIYDKNSGTKIEVKKCPNLTTLDLQGDLAPKSIELSFCTKLNKVGNTSFGKGKVKFLYLYQCSSVDEEFLEDLLSKIEFDTKWGELQLEGTKISPDSEVVKKFKEEHPGIKVSI
jgi:hypothetical protein